MNHVGHFQARVTAFSQKRKVVQIKMCTTVMEEENFKNNSILLKYWRAKRVKKTSTPFLFLVHNWIAILAIFLSGYSTTCEGCTCKHFLASLPLHYLIQNCIPFFVITTSREFCTFIYTNNVLKFISTSFWVKRKNVRRCNTVKTSLLSTISPALFFLAIRKFQFFSFFQSSKRRIDSWI